MIQKIYLFLSIAVLVSGCARSNTAAALPVNIDPGVDSSAWAQVPAGEFLVGQFNHPARLDYDYEIMVTDVTNEQYANYLNDALASGAVQIENGQVTGDYPGDEFHGYEHEEEIGPGKKPHLPLQEPGLRLAFDGEVFTPLPGYEIHPVTMVTWFGAQAYCEYFGWRLPSENEWEKAARGAAGLPYPWGEEIQRQNANYYSSRDPYEAASKPGGTTPVGFYNGGTYEGYQTIDSASPYGLYDMAGNVWQWVGDDYPDQHYRYLRGGSFQNYGYDLRVWTRNSAGPDYYSPAVGFRCARDPNVEQ